MMDDLCSEQVKHDRVVTMDFGRSHAQPYHRSEDGKALLSVLTVLQPLASHSSLRDQWQCVHHGPYHRLNLELDGK